MSEKPNEIGEILLDKYQLAQKLRVSAHTINRWHRTGKIPCLRVGNLVRFEWSSVKAALSKPAQPMDPFPFLSPREKEVR